MGGVRAGNQCGRVGRGSSSSSSSISTAESTDGRGREPRHTAAPPHLLSPIRESAASARSTSSAAQSSEARRDSHRQSGFSSRQQEPRTAGRLSHRSLRFNSSSKPGPAAGWHRHLPGSPALISAGYSTIFCRSRKSAVWREASTGCWNPLPGLVQGHLPSADSAGSGLLKLGNKPANARYSQPD